MLLDNNNLLVEMIKLVYKLAPYSRGSSCDQYRIIRTFQGYFLIEEKYMERINRI